MAFKMKKFSDDETIRRVWDVEEIKNLISRFSYFEAGNRREESLRCLWVSEAENMKTASFGRNWGFCIGMEAIREYYVNQNRFGAAGTATMHPFSTKLLCLAEDGKTAQGLWMGIGYDTAPNTAGKLTGMWVNERMAIDFKKEADGWKLWHVFIGTNYTENAGGNYIQQPLLTETHEYKHGNPAWYMVGRGREEMTCDVALFDQIVDYPEREAFKAVATKAAEVYTALYNDQISFPHLPVDYRTIDDVVNFDYDGFSSVAVTGEGRVL